MRRILFYALAAFAGLAVSAGVVFTVGFVAAVIPHAGLW